ncbi:MAG: ComEC/Rec2 family competence protein, partial [Thermoleophilia bacterium]|nr:ComEC/Rec2 family competence protein [Thermoleophilia bacterium]
MTRLATVVERHPRHIAVSALAAGLALARLPGFAFACVAIAGALALMAVRARPQVALTVCAIFVAAGTAGQLRLQSIDADPLTAVRVGATVQLRGYLLEHPRAGLHGSTMRTRVVAGADARQTIEIRTNAPAPPGAAIGAEFVARGRLMPVEATGRTPQARAYARYLLRNGVRRRLQTDAIVLTGGRRGGVLGLIDRIRVRSERTLAAGLPPEPAALLRGMVLGGDNGIPQPTTDAFRIAGLTHILAVSGQNVLLLVILVQAIAMAFGFGRLPRLLIPVALVCVYVPLCGAQASVIRAGAMGLAGLAALLASRPSSRVYALMLGSVVVLAWNPRATADVGAQLSFAAVVGIMAFTRPIAARLARWPRWMAEAFAATTGATIATAPLMAYHFGTFSVVSLAANVAGEPLIGPIVWLGSLAAAVGQFAQPAGALLNAPNEFLLGSLIEVAKAAASLPGAQLALPQFGGITLAIVSLPIVVAALAVNGWLPEPIARRLRALRPRVARLRPASVAPLLALCIAPLLTLAVAAALRRHTPAPPPRPSIVFLDVGQGDATLLLGSNGCDALIDGGPPGRGLPGRLRRLGVDRL